MEETLPEIESQSFKKKHIQEIIGDLSDAIEKAADERDLAVVKDTELRKALNVVEKFLRESKRICYGGMALNAHLPTGLKFYDFSKTLPDYDFFSPNPEEDVKKLVHSFHDAGFSDVSARVGMHEGTTKIFVNYTGMADISYMPNWLYNTLKERAIKEDGIYYADADFLRMNLYLELSRPRGEVERWDKVYKRLLLLNSAKKLNFGSCNKKKLEMTRINKKVHAEIINYLAEEKLIYSGAELKRIYSNPTTTAAGFIVNSTSPVIITTEAPEFHLPILRQIIHKEDPSLNLKNAHWKSKGDVIPEMFGVLSRGRVILLLIREQFCHSYNTVSLTKGRELRIASLDTAITMFYMLSFLKGMDGLVAKSCQCFAQTLVDISSNTRDKGVDSKFPLFVVTCHGHQPTKASLLRAKAERIKELKNKNKTKKNRSAQYNSALKKYRKTRKRRN